jgi:hypothetical protein
MAKSRRKATQVKFDESLPQIGANAAGMDIGARSGSMLVRMTRNRSADLRRSRRI